MGQNRPGNELQGSTDAGEFLDQLSVEQFFRSLHDDVSCPLIPVAIFVVNQQCERHVAQLVEALRYKSEGSGFDSRWGSLECF
jgi:hypothetical protein